MIKGLQLLKFLPAYGDLDTLGAKWDEGCMAIKPSTASMISIQPMWYTYISERSRM